MVYWNVHGGLATRLPLGLGPGPGRSIPPVPKLLGPQAEIKSSIQAVIG
jgi:hypothetical protein